MYIHQIWIGPHPAPVNNINTWKLQGFEHKLWNEEEYNKHFDPIPELKDHNDILFMSDIMRYNILYKFGGIYVDADSICICPLDEYITSKIPFVAFENEEAVPTLIKNSFMGFNPGHEMLEEIVEYCKNIKMKGEPWIETGTSLLTSFCKQYRVNILPSYIFFPQHYTGKQYCGHGKIYADHIWSSTTGKKWEQIDYSAKPDQSISVLIPSYNTPPHFLFECLESIKSQEGFFNMEVVWINDGSSEYYTRKLKEMLDMFSKTTRHTTVVYKELPKNVGVGEALRQGVELCTNEIIMRMDSDDVMKKNRFKTQLQFMKDHSECVVCTSNMESLVGIFLCEMQKLPEVYTPEVYEKSDEKLWITNHPAICMKKSAIMEIGNYTSEKFEDAILFAKIMRKHGAIYCIREPLVYYRNHANNVSKDTSGSEELAIKLRKILLE